MIQNIVYTSHNINIQVKITQEQERQCVIKFSRDHKHKFHSMRQKQSNIYSITLNLTHLLFFIYFIIALDPSEDCTGKNKKRL